MMTLRQFLKHRWLEFSRSPAFVANLAGFVFIALSMSTMVFVVVLMGYFWDVVGKEVAPTINPFDLLISLLQILLILDLILRPLTASRLDLPIAPYLFMLVRKRRLAVFILWEYFAGIGNFFMLTLLAGLSWKTFLFSEEPLRVSIWIIYYLLFLFLTTSLKLLISRLLLKNGLYRFVSWGVLIVIGGTVYLTNTNLTATFDHFLAMTVAQLGWMCIVLVLVNTFLFVINKRSLLSAMYID
jgi:hypothetical protein